MNAKNDAPDRDEVLYAFFEACERPTAQQILDWITRYPQFADDIQAHAAVRLDYAPGAEESDLEPDSTMLSRAHSRALNAIYLATQEADPTQDNLPIMSWDEALQRKGIGIPDLARKLDIDRMVLAEMAAGRMRLPLGARLVEDLTTELSVTPAWLVDAIAQRVASPRLGLPKSSGPPTIRSRSYEEVIRASKMSDVRKRYWLGED